MGSTRVAILVILFVLFCSVSWTTAQSAPIWLSPTNVAYNLPNEGLSEQSPERGVWSNISVGAGSRRSIPLLVMDSKKTLWIAFGNQNSATYLTTVWNYDPKTDLYRWVAGRGNPRNPGELGIPSPDNAPGQVWYTTATIDHNDNIWFMSTQYCCELWMFNTTSYLFTRMYGPGGNVTIDADGCFVTDSQNNLWLISGDSYKNKVWHFNTTSLVLTLISDNPHMSTVYGDTPFYGGRQGPSCDIDTNDRVWLFGGLFEGGSYFPVYSDVWSFDTRTTQWQLERGSNATIDNWAVVVSEDFHPDNLPPAREYASMVDRKDGTLLVACGDRQPVLQLFDDVWLFNKTSKQWKMIYGEPNQLNVLGNFTHYRTPGLVMPSRWWQGTAKGLNVDGDLFIIGGISPDFTPLNDITLIPSDQCSNDATHSCDLNAHCVEEMIGYSCQCDEGFTGDGYNCTAIPSPPVDPPISAPLSSDEPIQSPISALEPVSSPLSVSAPQSNTIVSSGSCIIVSWLVVLVSVLM